MTTTPILGLYSIVRSIATTTMRFGSLGDHGVQLAPGDQYAQPGNIIDKLSTLENRRKFLSFERALAGFTDDASVVHPPTLELLSLPGIYLFDTTLHVTKQLTLVNGSLVLADPSWGGEETVLTGAFGAIAGGTVAVNVAVLTFSQPVTGFTVSDLVLTRGGTPVTITGVTDSVSGAVHTLSGFSGITTTNGNYVLTLPHTGTGVADAENNPLSADVTVSWTKS